MNSHEKILNQIIIELKPSSKAIFVTGSYARNEATSKSDLDILAITKSDHSFEEKKIDGVVVEIKRNTMEGFKSKMDLDPVNVYQWLDAKAVFDPEDLLTDLKSYAQKILDNFTPSDFPYKWLQSAKIKIESAKEAKNELLLGFNVSNILWKIVEGFYALNSLPTPPSSTAFRRMSDLQKVPENFPVIWNEALTGSLQVRSKATVDLIKYLLSQKI